MNIPEIWHKIKSFSRSHHGETVLVLLILIACSLISFYLGRSSIKPLQSPTEQNIGLNQDLDYSLSDPVEYKSGSLAAAVYGSSTSPKIDPNGTILDQNREVAIQNDLGPNNGSSTPRYVASRKGRVYYFTWCSGAKNILAENRIYFNSAQEARVVGLKASMACPGLD